MAATTMSENEQERSAAFETMRRQLFQHALDLAERGECGCCIARAFAHTAVDIGMHGGHMPAVKPMLEALLDDIGPVEPYCEH